MAAASQHRDLDREQQLKILYYEREQYEFQIDQSFFFISTDGHMTERLRVGFDVDFSRLQGRPPPV